ncbi:hypothetical protein [Litorilituus sediminis]|uniref:Uncharacterized protein n=1 Tax=Litorilituus sediminis TaxID=718192 RepID=A0A4P6P5W5_9GAMM|nr:hypothetical protein [Litorilituus sediminis]QBG36893.1 hypothetical protein EMK97_14775 [Litorilituus sediminis]
MKFTKALLLSLALSSAANAAGPFGLEMGMSLKDIGGEAKQIAPGKYSVSSVPKPHSLFDTYIVQVAPDVGLCYIKAIGKDISTSTYGVELKSSFYNLQGKLEKAYGSSKVTDMLLSGSIWNEPNDWMMGLIKKERYLFAIWDAESKATLKNNLAAIAMAAKPSSKSAGYLAVDYSFTNEEQCNSAIAAMEDDAL